jgi:hypothetical protein
MMDDADIFRISPPNRMIAKNIPYLIAFDPIFRAKLKLKNHHLDAQNFDIGQK